MSLADKIRLKKERAAQARKKEAEEQEQEVINNNVQSIEDIQKGIQDEKDGIVSEIDGKSHKGLLCPVCKTIGGKFSVSQTKAVPGGILRLRKCKSCDTISETMEKIISIKNA